MTERPTPRRHHPRRPAFLVVALLLAACGGNLTDAEVLAINGVQSDAATSPTRAGTATAPGATPGTAADGTPLTGGTSTGAGPAGGTAAGTDPGTGEPATPGAESTAPVGTPGETGPIVLGNVGTYSGPAGASTAGIPRALQVWAASMNQQGGLFGREVQIIVQDDGGDPARFGSAVRDLVENRNVIAFVGESTLGLQGGAAYLEANGIPVIGTDCSTTAWYGSPVFFPQCGPINDTTAALGIKATSEATGFRRLGLAYCTETPVCSDGARALAQAAATVGVEVVYNQGISLAQIDFTANCQASRDAGAQMFAVLGDANTLSRFARSCDRQGYRPQYVQPSITTNAETTSTPGLENVVLPLQTFAFAGGTSPAFEEFTESMGAYAPNEVIGAASSYGWTAAKLFELAANRAAATRQSLTPQTLIAAMHTIQGETLGGLTVALDFTGTTPNNASCGFIIQADGPGRWTLPVGEGPYC